MRADIIWAGIAGLIVLTACQRHPLPMPGMARVTDVPTTPSAASGPVQIDIVGVGSPYFRPRRVAVWVGQEVVWTNRDPVPHTATDDLERWDSGMLGLNESYRHVFDQPGTYTYFCRPHVWMTATVIVVPAAKLQPAKPR